MPKVLDPLNIKLLNFFANPQEQARRVFHGRGHVYPGLEMICIDWFKPLLLISVFKQCDLILDILAAIAAADVHSQISTIVIQNRYEHKAPIEVVHGILPEELVVTENGLKLLVKPGGQQNAGMFLDMRPLRRWLQENSKEKNILNLFAYTCSFSVAALAGGAAYVTNVDMSKTSIEWGKKNHQLNEQPLEDVRSIPHKVLKSWGRIQKFGPYDTVIIDPPSSQRGSFNVEKNYAALIRRLPMLCKSEATVIATVNSPLLRLNFLPQLFQANLPEAKFIGMIDASPEFEERFPDKGLKIYRYQMPSETG